MVVVVVRSATAGPPELDMLPHLASDPHLLHLQLQVQLYSSRADVPLMYCPLTPAVQPTPLIWLLLPGACKPPSATTPAVLLV
jgi:hypothetical protein